MKRKVVVFDDFASYCPYYNNDTSVNNGYGCDHPDQKETDPDDNGKQQGKCYNWSCPLGFEPDEEDWNNPDVDFDGAQRDEFIRCSCSNLNELDKCSCDNFDGSEHLTVNTGPDATADEKAALYNYERFLNRYNRDWDGGTWKHLHKK